MSVASDLVRATPPGSVTAVVGRPGTGVSSTLAAACNAAVGIGISSAMACWERPPSGWGDALDDAVICPYVVAWSVDDLSDFAELARVGEGALLAADYLQLIARDAAGAVAGLRVLAARRQWKLFVGVMASRSGSSDDLIDLCDAYVTLRNLGHTL